MQSSMLQLWTFFVFNGGFKHMSVAAGDGVKNFDKKPVFTEFV